MKKIVRITENDLTRIVKMVIKEQSGSPVKRNHYNQYELHNVLRDLDIDNINRIADNLLKAKGMNVNPDETEITIQIQKLNTYNDIVNLNKRLKSEGGLEGFLNSTIEDRMLFGDEWDRKRIVKAINRASIKSGKGSIAKIEGNVREKKKVIINI
jgi:hypothetical protein